MASDTLAVVGATGGAGATRFAVEAAGALALAGEDVAIVDADLATQGLGRYLAGELRPDLTAVLADDAPLEEALYPLPVEAPGTVRVCPAAAPFERLSRAKTAGAAREFEKQLAAAALSHDVVLVDTPAVAANQAVAAASAADRVAVVAPNTDRGRDGLALVQGRLRDVDAGDDAVLARPADGPGSLEGADARLPDLDVAPASACPTAVDDPETAEPLVESVEAALGRSLEVTIEAESGTFDGLLPGSD